MRNVLIALFLAGLVVGSAFAGGPDEKALQRVVAVQERHTPALMARAGVVGTAVGWDGEELVIRLYVVADQNRAGLPARLEDVPVRPAVSGKIRALAEDTTKRYRPAPIGVSTGHPNVTAGTIGARVKDGDGNIYALSNNHVCADENRAEIGDPILQPGPYDGGTLGDTFATLSDFEEIKFARGRNVFNNLMDAAIARSTPEELDRVTLSDGYGVPSGELADAEIGLPVKKYGRTTHLTEGWVDGINATVDVAYSRGKVARFVDQIIIGPGTFSAGGDSGSLVVTSEGNHPVGLLFAGSDTITIANPIAPVLERFGVSVDAGPDAPLTDVAITAVSAPATVVQGDVVAVDVTVKNVGNQDVAGPVEVSLAVKDAAGQTIGTDTAAIADGLAAGASETLVFSWDTTGAALGDYVLVASHGVEDENEANDSMAAAVEVVAEPPVIEAYVADLEGLVDLKGKSGKWAATVIVYVVDDAGPVAGASVEGTWSGGFNGSVSGLTDSDGKATFQTKPLEGETSVTFTVTNLTDADGGTPEITVSP